MSLENKRVTVSLLDSLFMALEVHPKEVKSSLESNSFLDQPLFYDTFDDYLMQDPSLGSRKWCTALALTLLFRSQIKELSNQHQKARDAEDKALQKLRDDFAQKAALSTQISMKAKSALTFFLSIKTGLKYLLMIF